MPINTLELAKRMTGDLDKAVVQKSVTGFLTDNAWRAKFVGAKTMLVPYTEFSGMGNYDRDNGFVQESITVGNTAYELEMDRGRTLQLDAQDEDETGVPDLAGKITGEYVRTRVVPEVDAYTLSKFATYAIANTQTVTGTLASQCYKIFTDAANRIYDALGYDQQLVAFVDPAFMAAIQSTAELTRQITVSNFKQGDVNLKVQSINGIALRPVPSARMKSAYTFNDGTSTGQTAGGFAPAAGARNVRLLMMAQGAGVLVKKVENTRVFTPDVNQKANAWKFDIRMYYGAFTKNSLKKGIVAFSEAQ